MYVYTHVYACVHACPDSQATPISHPPTKQTRNQNKTKQDLKEEYRLYRKQALAALREKDAAIAALGGQASAPTPSPAGGGRNGGNGASAGGGLNLQDPSVVYLRNLCQKFFSTESPEVRAVVG